MAEFFFQPFIMQKNGLSIFKGYALDDSRININEYFDSFDFRNEFISIYNSLSANDVFYITWESFEKALLAQEPLMQYLPHMNMDLKNLASEYFDLLEDESKIFLRVKDRFLLEERSKKENCIRIGHQLKSITCPRCDGRKILPYEIDRGRCWGCNASGIIPNPNHPENKNKSISIFALCFMKQINGEWFVVKSRY